ncbi:MAG TPA: hypothetical protein VK858_11780 [Longimicrobiales bacterium]|nr:hypothetical protein [Longimicrobiales bacterium]
MSHLEILPVDITTLDVDAIVDAASFRPLADHPLMPGRPSIP